MYTTSVSDPSAIHYYNTNLSSTDTYKEVLKGLREQFWQISNPYTVQDIVEQLKKYMDGCIDLTEFFDDFRKCFIPEEAKRQLQLYSETVKKLSQQTQSKHEMAQLSAGIINDLTQIAKELEPHILEKMADHWKELSILLGIPQVKMANSQVIIALMTHIERDDREALLEVVRGMCNKDLQLMEEYFDKMEWNDDLETLADEVFECRPKTNEGITAYWNNLPEFFFDKIFYLADPTTGEMLNRTIIFAEKKRTDLLLHLHDGVVVKISSSFDVELMQKFTYKRLWSQILNGTLTSQEDFEIESSADMPEGKGIPSGTYCLNGPNKKKDNALNPYIEMTLRDLQGKDRYYLWSPYKKGELSEAKIHVQKCGKYEKKDLFSCPRFEFDRKYAAVKINSKSLSGIRRHNIDNCIKIKSELDSNKKTAFYLQQITAEINKIRASLLKHDNRELLDLLIDQLISNKLEKIDLSSIQASPNLLAKCAELDKRLQTVSKKYTENLKIQRSTESILMQVVYEANYACLVNKENNVLIAKTMELLTASDQHLTKMHGKELVLFMGETGSGKSTAVAYFLDAKLEVFENQIGNQVVRIKEGTLDDDKVPKIGQSFGTSETIYTQGFEAPGSQVMLGDCPGFNDTRGENFELCTNLSIDQAVKNANQIRAIVVSVPVNAFLDRGNQVINLIQIVQERFPGAFNIEDSEKSKNTPTVYLLITKQKQAQPGVVSAIEKGTTFSEILKEMTDNLTKLVDRGLGEGDFEFDTCLARQKIWQSIVQMHNSQQVDILRIGNNRLKTRVREKYVNSRCVQGPLNYKKAMKSEEMKKKFGDCIQQSTHTWTHLILKEYLKELPSSIAAKFSEIVNKKEEKVRVEQELVERINRLAQCKIEKASIKQMIQDLLGDPASLNDALRQELEKKVIAASEAELTHEKQQLDKIERALENDRNKKQAHKEKILAVDQQIANIKEVKKALLLEKKKLKEGTTKKVLYKSRKFSPGERIYIAHYKAKDLDKIREKSYRECKKMNPKDLDRIRIKSKKTNINEFQGTFEQVAIIHKKYQLVPKGKNLEEFKKGKAIEGYFAEMEGTGFEIDMKINALPDGNKVAYGYKLNFVANPDKLPCLTISHTIPNHELNSAAIVNIDAELNQNKKRKIELRLEKNGSEEIPGLIKDLENLNREIQILEKGKLTALNRILNLEKAKTLKQREELLEQKEDELEHKKHEIKSLEDMSKLRDQIASFEVEIESREKQRIELVKKKRNYALILKTQIKSAELLRKFSDLAIGTSSKGKRKIVDENNPYASITEKLLQTCEEFNAIYDREIDQLEDKINKDLGL